jgi:hypothetical protein
MKLDLLPDGSEDCPLIRMYDFDGAEIDRLLVELAALASGAQKIVPVHDLPGTASIANCKLFLRLGGRDHGLTSLHEPASFECALTPDGWEQVASLVEPFCQGGKRGYQWLDSHGDIRWLLSSNGDW